MHELWNEIQYYRSGEICLSIMLTILTHMFTTLSCHLLGEHSTSVLKPSSLQFTL